jgi:hypothetical protein
MAGAEVEDVLAILLRESRELVRLFFHNGKSVAVGVGQIRTYPEESGEW